MLPSNLPWKSLKYETGNFTISQAGKEYVAFFFDGDDDFVARTLNFLHNYGVVNRKTSFKKNGIQYVLCLFDQLRKGLVEAFKGEILKQRHPNIKFQTGRDENDEDFVTWDENILQKMGEEMMEDFLVSNVEYRNLLLYNDSCESDFFILGSIDSKCDRNKK